MIRVSSMRSEWVLWNISQTKVCISCESSGTDECFCVKYVCVYLHRQGCECRVLTPIPGVAPRRNMIVMICFMLSIRFFSQSKLCFDMKCGCFQFSTT